MRQPAATSGNQRQPAATSGNQRQPGPFSDFVQAYPQLTKRPGPVATKARE